MVDVCEEIPASMRMASMWKPNGFIVLLFGEIEVCVLD